MEKAIFCWSGGKDSSFCLHEVLEQKIYDVKYLLTTVNENFRRISMHGVREELLDAQAISIGIPLKKMYVNEGSYDEYERKMEELLLAAKAEGISTVIFGDIFLEDLRKYREENLAKVKMNAVFPLWKRDTRELVNTFISLGYKTITCCVDDTFLSQDMVGIEINEQFLAALPDTVDCCGENGEFHTFCFDGPIFKTPVTFNVGEKVYKPIEIKYTVTEPATKGFWHCDLVPESGAKSIPRF